MNSSPNRQRLCQDARTDARRRIYRKGRRLIIQSALGAIAALLLTAWLVDSYTGEWLLTGAGFLRDVLLVALLVLLAEGALFVLYRGISLVDAHRFASRQAEEREASQ